MRYFDGVELQSITNKAEEIKMFFEKVMPHLVSNDQKECAGLVSQIGESVVLSNKDITADITLQTKKETGGKQWVILTLGFVNSFIDSKGETKYRINDDYPPVRFYDDGKQKKVFIMNIGSKFLKPMVYEVGGSQSDFREEWTKLSNCLKATREINEALLEVKEPMLAFNNAVDTNDITDVIPHDNKVTIVCGLDKREIPLVVHFDSPNVPQFDPCTFYNDYSDSTKNVLIEIKGMPKKDKKEDKPN